MATFKEIRGQLIRKYTTNPTDPLEGQMWYNSTTGTLKGVVTTSAWSSSSPYLSANSYSAGFGTQAAGVQAGGDAPSPPSPACTNVTGEFDGTGWAASGNMNTARRGMGVAANAPQTAGLIFGGSDGSVPTQYALCEEYDGSTWSEVTNIPGNRNNVGGLGTQTAGMCLSSVPSTSTLEYNGASWTAGGALSTARTGSQGTGTGTQTAGLCVGGPPNPGVGGAVEEYNGASWTAGGTLPTVAEKNWNVGTQSDAMEIGGSSYPVSPGVLSTCFKYDGSTWTATGALGTGRYSAAGGGSSSSAFISAGRTLPSTATTEVFNTASTVVTAGAWASGGAMNTARYGGAGAGTQTLAVVFGGIAPGPTGATETYDGASWTTSPASLNTARSNLAGFGTSTAAIAAGGGNPGGVTSTESFNGSAWTANPTGLNTARKHLSSAIQGTSTAGLVFGGEAPPGYQTATESWGGSTWTSVNSMNTGLSDGAGAGTQTSALAFGGEPAQATTEEWNGTSWTAATAMINARTACAASGSQTAALAFGSNPAPFRILTEGYDGSAWSTRPSMATSRYGIVGAGTSTAGLAAGGYITVPSPAVSAVTEEFNGETSAANIVTVTTS